MLAGLVGGGGPSSSKSGAGSHLQQQRKRGLSPDKANAASSGENKLQKRRRVVRTRPSSEGASLLWVDKYQPLYLDEMELNKEFSKLMIRASASNEFPHLLLYGPEGAGKMTRVYALLREIFGEAVDETTTYLATIQHPPKTGTKFEICVKSSLYHMELHLADVGFKDVKVAKTLIKEFTTGRPINGAPFKVIILKGADKLSHECQTALRRLIEVRSTYNRFIFVSNSIGSMILPIQSRCFPFRLPLPDDVEIENACKAVLMKEKLDSLIPEFDFKAIILASGNDMRKALLILETMVTSRDYKNVKVSPWERICQEVALSLLQQDGVPRTILDIRSKFYTLLAATVTGDKILTQVCTELSKMAPALTSTIWHIASVYDVLLKRCGKEIFALEAFAARILAWISGEKRKAKMQQGK